MKVWIHINGIQEGPYELEKLPLNRIKPDTPVWYEGLDYWKEASQAPEVARLLSQGQHQDKPAEAQAEVAIERAEAQAEVAIERGEAEAEAAIERGEAEAEAAIERGEAEAETAIERGEAEAETAIERGEAEAEVLIEEKEDAATEIVTEATETINNFCENVDVQEENDSQQQEPYVNEAHGEEARPYGGQPYGGQPYGGQPYYGTGAYTPPEQNGNEASTYLIWAILITLLCCNPIGIIAIITSVITRRRNNNYDYAGAKRMSEATAWWIMIAIVTSLIMAPFMSLVSL